jgi:hypothetical protein
VYNGHALGTLTMLGVVRLPLCATAHMHFPYLDRRWCWLHTLRAHLSISERLYMVSRGGRLYRACGWTAFHLSCLSVAHGCHRTIVPVTDRRAARPPLGLRPMCAGCARMCRVQQSFDAPTCGSLYRGHSCTMGTHLAPSLFLVLVCLVPLPLRANRTYYYYISDRRWCVDCTHSGLISERLCMVSCGGRLYRACGWTASTPLFGSWMPSPL